MIVSLKLGRYTRDIEYQLSYEKQSLCFLTELISNMTHYFVWDNRRFSELTHHKPALGV